MLEELNSGSKSAKVTQRSCQYRAHPKAGHILQAHFRTDNCYYFDSKLFRYLLGLVLFWRLKTHLGAWAAEGIAAKIGPSEDSL